jgi:rhodanese-related sulfurtransferase
MPQRRRYDDVLTPQKEWTAMVRATMASVILGAVMALAGCGEEAAAPIPELSVDEVARRLEAGDIVAVDANGEETRRERGIVPGARLLTSSGSYNPTAELPSDQSTALVFYCGGTQCRASDNAAERAREHGYSNVSVMRAGIAGWVEAGKEVTHPQSC